MGPVATAVYSVHFLSESG